jgi:Cu/Ag efflux protein CusF
MKTILILILAFAFFECGGQNAPPAGNQVFKAANDSANLTPNNPLPANTSPVPSPSVAPTSAPDKSKIKLYDGKGVVTKINLELVSVELDHEEIKGLMPKMIMEFYVKEKSQLEKLKVGDKVDFVLEDNAGAEQIIKIVKSK